MKPNMGQTVMLGFAVLSPTYNIERVASQDLIGRPDTGV